MPETSAARRNILQRIRTAQGRPPEASATEHATVADYLARHPEGPRPAIGDALVERFRHQAEKLSSTVEIVPGAAAIAQAVARYLEGHALGRSAVVAGALGDLGWADAGIEARLGSARDADLVGIGHAFCALAETGTLVFLSSPQTPATVNLLPETHIAVVAEDRIVAGMEDAFSLIRKEHGALPRAVNLVSGPSRTGDIEQTIVLGAHGPYRVHILIVAPA